MRLLIFFAATVTIFNKLRLITGLNGGLVTGVSPGLVVGGLNPALLTGGTAFIGQPQLAQVVPGVSPFMMQPPMVPASPFGFPNAGPQQQQQPQPQPQQPFPFPPANGGLPYYVGFPQAQPGMFPPQQQVAGGNPQQQQQTPETPVRRFKRMIRRLQRINAVVAHKDPVPTVTTPSPTTVADDIASV
ncbi:hypothetical protein ACEWY4_006689 [Coilia grayii]|uniref:Uncharacterized protein n=1 Tax=Coilia grayii TaxID=363190 RepID=A0ABD1KEB3_9TELE